VTVVVAVASSMYAGIGLGPIAVVIANADGVGFSEGRQRRFFKKDSFFYFFLFFVSFEYLVSEEMTPE
jgi:hypothetical protein